MVLKEKRNAYVRMASLFELLASHLRFRRGPRRLRGNDLASSLPYDFRKAQPSDLDFIVAEIIEGAKHGHFLDRYLTPEGEEGLRKGLQILIQHERWLCGPSYAPEYYDATLFVYCCVTTNEPVGFLVFKSKDPLKDEPRTSDADLELYMGGILKEHRRNGHGRGMIELAIRMSVGRKLYARCYHESATMRRILEKAGFEILPTTLSGIDELGLDNS